ncbi:MAG: cytochrome c [Phycisphaeraceae bacterium]|nr:cytochrome c [Phycisphaeraceae bacterium]
MPPRALIFGGLLVVLLLLIPPAVIARIRSEPSPNRPVRLFQDMAFQSRFNPQSENPLFADLRAMRPPILGAVARGELRADGHLDAGVVDGAWATTLPPNPETQASLEFLERGRARFNIYCALCHGYAGGGDGVINQRAMELLTNINGPVNGTTWVQAKNLVHDETVVTQPIGQIYNTITHGIRNMAGYESQISVQDRWAIALYVKALQRSQNARESDVPADLRSRLD